MGGGYLISANEMNLGMIRCRAGSIARPVDLQPSTLRDNFATAAPCVDAKRLETCKLIQHAINQIFLRMNTEICYCGNVFCVVQILEKIDTI